MDRREMLRVMAVTGLGAVMVPLLKVARARGEGRSSDDQGNCVIIPHETAGPFTMDLAKKPEFLRRDITDGKTGVPLELLLTVVNVHDHCKPIANARVDIWHCDKDGVYSGFDEGRGETFLRGIQMTDEKGRVTFNTVYPGWYGGRATHIHFEVYLNNGKVATSQVAFPEDVTRDVYQSPLYAERGQNRSVESNASDFVFGHPEGALPRELCTIKANATGGYDAALNVGIAV